MVNLQAWHYLIIPSLVLLHLVVSPYTKVEESFNIQAVHDVLAYGVPTTNAHYKFKALYDHMTFSGSVPRTFIGALVTAAVAQPFVWLGGFEDLEEQSIARGVLGLLNAVALTFFAKSVRKAYGDRTALWYIALQASQFHVFYYASRTLPNMFAFCLSTFALAVNLPDPRSSLNAVKKARLSLYLLTLATVIFRSELAILLASQACYTLLRTPGLSNQIALIRYTILPAILTATIVGLILTVGVDTYFWQSSSFLWPEAAAFLFNVLPSKDHEGASAWGTSPWHWYFTSAIPRLILSPSLLLIPWGSVFTTQQSSILDNIIPAFSYTALYSILPHKETRFLFPIIPSLTLASALTMSYLSIRRQILTKVFTISIVISTLAISIFSHAILLPLSAQSYPGGHALQSLHRHHQNLLQNQPEKYPMQPQIKVHLTNLALQTGITRFLEQTSFPFLSFNRSGHYKATTSQKRFVLPGSPDGRKPALTHYPKPSNSASTTLHSKSRKAPLWIYDKSSSESEFLTATFWQQFEYVIVEEPGRVIGAWEIIGESKALRSARPRILRSDENRGMIILGSSDQSVASSDGVYELLVAMYGSYIAGLYAAVHDVLREGHGVGFSLTGGKWVDWGLETRLYVLKSSVSGISPDEIDSI